MEEVVDRGFLDLALDILEDQFVEEVEVKRALVFEPVPVPRAGEVPSPQARASVINLTFAFEGAGYTQATGNFDKQGLSWGGLQWCLGQGSLQPVLRACFEADTMGFRRCLGDGTQAVLDVAYGRTPWPKLSLLMNYAPPKYALQEPWKTRFQELGRVPAFQEVQRRFCGNVMQKAINYCTQYALKSIRALSLCFDVCTQNGSIHGVARQRVDTAKTKSVGELDFLKIIAIGVADACNPRWRADVFSRKMAIATGTGTVHGKAYDMGAQGITMDPWAGIQTATKGLAQEPMDSFDWFRRFGND